MPKTLPVQTSTRPVRVCLIMHSTRSDNLGVGALTVSEVEILRGIGRDLGRPLDITVMDWKDARAPYVSGPDVRLVDLDMKTMLNPFGFFATVLRQDLVIDIGAGDSFADIYGAGRLNRMFLMKYLTHLARTPLVMAPQTVGPFTKPVSTFFAKLSMRLCAVVATRDRLSTEAVRKMGLTREVIEASDVALRLPYDPPAPRAPGGPVKVGINVSGLLMGGGYTGKNEFGLTMDYPGLMRDLIRHFQNHPDGCEVHLVPHVIVQGGRMAAEDDYRASQALAAEFPGLVLAPAFASPSQAKSYIAGLDFFMGARMHACIAAFSSGVPVVPMAYSRKFEGLFGSLGYGRTVDCTRESSATILAKIAAAYEDRAVLADEAAAALKLGRDKLGGYETALRALMGRSGG
jgi:polysaccharide pyruvyl transferase WcaK-like protein